MKTTTRFFASFASAALALALSAASSPAAGNYTVVWGGNHDGQLDIPAAALTNATQIVADAHHTLAVVGERIVGWGSSEDGALSFNPDLQNIAFVATGENSGVAINRYGGATFWGADTNYNFRNDFPGNLYGHTYVSAALGRDHGLLLTDTGAVEAWGAPESMVPVSTPNSEWKSGFTAVAAGRNFSMGLSNGVVHVAAPTNDPDKILEIPAAATQIDPRTRRGGIEAIAAGPYHAMALTTNGEVLVWGAWCPEDQDDPIDDSFWSNAVPKVRAPLPRNSHGNVTNVPPAALSGVQAIAAGYNFCAVVATNGEVLVWGSEQGTGGVLAKIPACAARDVKAIAAGHQHIVIRSTWLPPEFTGNSLPDAHLESPYTAVIPLRADPAAAVKALDSRLLPPGITLAPNGTFSGIPTKRGTNFFNVVASNAYGSVTQQFSIVVKDRELRAPEWITAELPPAVAGFPYNYQAGLPSNGFQLEATESPVFSADAMLPSWLSLSPSGLLSGTPADSDVDTAYPTFTAANSAGSTNRMLLVSVVGQSSATPPVIGLESIPDLLVETLSSIDLQIVGATSVSLSGDLATSFRIVSSNGTWLLTGTPAAGLQGDDRTAVVVAANSAAAATNEYLVNVKGGPRWVTTSIPDAIIGTPYTATLAADWADSYQIAAADLRPIPLSFSMATNGNGKVVAVLSGTPTNTVKTKFSIPVSAVNAYGNASQTFTLSLRDTPAPGDDPGYRFVSIVPSSSNLVLSWIVTNGTDSAAVLISTTNLLSWPATGTLYNASPATITPRPSVPTHYRLQMP